MQTEFALVLRAISRLLIILFGTFSVLRVIILFVLDVCWQGYEHIFHAQRLTPKANHC